MDWSLVLSRQSNCFTTVRSFYNFIAVAFQSLTRELTQHLFIFNQQDGLRSPRHFLAFNIALVFFNAIVNTRQVDLEGGPSADFAIHPDIAALLFDDAVARRQPQAGSLAHLFRGEERFENPRQRFLINAMTRIGNGQHNVRTDLSSRVILNVTFVKMDIDEGYV